MFPAFGFAEPRPPGVISATPPHKPYREGDEYVCPKCGKRWGVGEPEPTCLDDTLT